MPQPGMPMPMRDNTQTNKNIMKKEYKITNTKIKKIDKIGNV